MSAEEISALYADGPFCNACKPPEHCAACLEDIAWLEAPLTDEEQAAIEAADE